MLVVPIDRHVDVVMHSRCAPEEQVERPTAGDVPRPGEAGEQGGQRLSDFASFQLYVGCGSSRDYGGLTTHFVIVKVGRPMDSIAVTPGGGGGESSEREGISCCLPGIPGLPGGTASWQRASEFLPRLANAAVEPAGE